MTGNIFIKTFIICKNNRHIRAKIQPTEVDNTS